ncbi:MAG: adenylosuccinate lyase [Candidatus Aenigmarchaeota archaeon]|nr:adenylosuccinate lyase [Candidatus Aenigmarchaeota archaeon]
MMATVDSLEALCPFDGRYREDDRYAPELNRLASHMSERGLIANRLRMEGEYLIALSEEPGVGLRGFSDVEKSLVRGLYGFPIEDARIVKAIETTGYKNFPRTRHDVRSLGYFMKDKLEGTSLEDVLPWLHFALTSEDATNIAYGLMLSDTLSEVILPLGDELHDQLGSLADKYKDPPMLARTHGQPAVPTIFGKEFKNFFARLGRQLDQLGDYQVLVKLNGAVGNYNAHHAAYPNVDWLAFTQRFIEKFNKGREIRLKPNLVTTQIEPHDTYAELFDNLRRMNKVVMQLDKDMWRYISDEWIKQKADDAPGSSTMPQKINPEDLERGWGNLEIANAMYDMFSRVLPENMLQRALFDSTIERTFGFALAAHMLGYRSTIIGLGKSGVNEEKAKAALNEHPEVIAEGLQTILRREGRTDAYDQLVELTKGRKGTMDDFRQFIDGLDIPDTVKEEMRSLTPETYTGLAKRIAEEC